MNAAYTPKQYVCSGPGVPPTEHTVYSLTDALEDQRYNNDRSAISLLNPSESHTDVDGDTWTRVS